jgi:3D (Asp-Asp-Asp) domain-containing protein
MLKHVAALVVAIALTTLGAEAKPATHPPHHRSHVSYCCDPRANHVLHPLAKPAPRLVHRILHPGWLSGQMIPLGVFRLTSYTGGDPAQDTGIHTALGKIAAYGLVAVDPRIIPLGTHLYIEGYGPAIAADTGGAIIGPHIDLCFGIGGRGTLAHANALAWGTHYGKVYIVKRKS